VGVLLLNFVMGSVSLALAQADPGFRTWLSRLNGSKWVGINDQYTKAWMELQGDSLTAWNYYPPPYGGNTAKQWSVKLEQRRFTATWPNGKVSICEISEDGLVITVEYSTGEVFKYIKGN
jgi:hypothetical protein